MMLHIMHHISFPVTFFKTFFSCFYIVYTNLLKMGGLSVTLDQFILTVLFTL